MVTDISGSEKAEKAEQFLWPAVLLMSREHYGTDESARRADHPA